MKCRASQELIFAQIPWASAGAEKSIANKEKSKDQNLDVNNKSDGPQESTIEEQLLAALLAANEELLEVLKQYDDLERVAMERKAEDRSRREVKMDRRVSRRDSLFNVSENQLILA